MNTFAEVRQFFDQSLRLSNQANTICDMLYTTEQLIYYIIGSARVFRIYCTFVTFLHVASCALARIRNKSDVTDPGGPLTPTKRFTEFKNRFSTKIQRPMLHGAKRKRCKKFMLKSGFKPQTFHL